MNDIDWNRLQPMRVATGSHSEGSEYGCAMNVVSYITGEKEITDYPQCSDDILARMVQLLNDTLGTLRGDSLNVLHPVVIGGAAYPGTFSGNLLTPEDAVEVVRIGCMTIGTKNIATLYTSQEWAHDVIGRAVEVLGLTTLQAVDRGLVLYGWDIYGGVVVALRAVAETNDASRLIDFVEWSILRFRELAGLETSVEINHEVLAKALV